MFVTDNKLKLNSRKMSIKVLIGMLNKVHTNAGDVLII